jgi:hypothetical protein
MDWKEKMKKGMEMVAEACKGNEDWNSCEECPFSTLCDAILLKYSDWNKHGQYWDMYTIIGEELEEDKEGE